MIPPLRLLLKVVCVPEVAKPIEHTPPVGDAPEPALTTASVTEVPE